MRLDELVSSSVAALLCLLILKHCHKTMVLVVLLCVPKLISSFQKLRLPLGFTVFSRLLFLFLM